MATDGAEETKVNEKGMVTIPVGIRRRLDIDGGDKLQWDVTDEGELTVTVIQQHYGAFADDGLKADFDGESDTHDLAGYESKFPKDA